MSEKILKGEDFLNRYRISGRLTTRSPLHVGTGERQPAEQTGDDAEQTAEIGLVARDYQGKPLIPGTAIKGVLRHWLLHILASMGEAWAVERDFNHADYTDKTQQQQHDIIRSRFSWLEMLFGTQFNEGKIEVWDATCATEAAAVADDFLNWSSERLSYVTTSVAIDPATGTAQDGLLYSNEVVPPGVSFDFTLVGQNLTELELGLVLFALQGFNSSIYPIQVGARSGAGYGLMRYSNTSIAALDRDKVSAWVQHVMSGAQDAAGYFALRELNEAEQNRLIEAAKTAVISTLPERHV